MNFYYNAGDLNQRLNDLAKGDPMSANCPSCGSTQMESVVSSGKCPKCGKQLRVNIYFSPKSNTAVCPSCQGTIKLPTKAHFDCPDCGTVLQKVAIL